MNTETHIADRPVARASHDDDAHQALHDRLMAEAERLKPLLLRNAALHEQRGELTPEVLEALDGLGAFKLLLPKRLGGLCAPAATMTALGAKISQSCPTAGWLVTVMNSAAWVASKAPERMQKAIFAKGPVRVCASTNGAGTLTRRGADYVVTGKWSYASGSHHSEWACAPAVGEDGTVYDVAMPMAKLKIENTWRVAGMKGTGSDSLVAENVVVQPEWFCTMDELWGGSGKSGFVELSDRWMLWPLMRAKLLGVLVGAAEGLFETVVAGKSKAIMYTSYTERSGSPVYQARVGEIAAKIRAMRIVMENSVEAIDRAAMDKRILSYAECAQMRGLVGVAVDTLTEQVDKLMSLAGSSAFAEANAAQRLWRDFSAAARHAVFYSDSHYEVYGRQLLGVEPNLVPVEMV